MRTSAPGTVHDIESPPTTTRSHSADRHGRTPARASVTRDPGTSVPAPRGPRRTA
ncbi:hypothetical protein [Actinomadura fibrosa]|uniref:Uncharacterized protein n=1 Tax=Actinomadura fibrosa TaxID=111802 RepID=A0ABW2XW68_9ACTN|nr:hypothetical protein [Actinomadura fibrosa]